MVQTDSMGTAETAPVIWQEDLQIHSYDVDFRKRATAEAICRLFFEAAWNHAEKLGFGYSHLASQGLLWVLARLLIRIYSYPQWGQEAKLRTWPRGISGAFALRDFEILSADGNQLAAGASSWLVLNAKTHRPQRIDRLLLNIPAGLARNAAQPEPRKLLSLTQADETLSTNARYSDIDVNGHVNSARYVGWLLDSYSMDFLGANTLQVLEINYVSETKVNDAVNVRSRRRTAGEFSHSIVKADQSEVCRADLTWIAESPDKLLSSPAISA